MTTYLPRISNKSRTLRPACVCCRTVAISFALVMSGTAVAQQQPAPPSLRPGDIVAIFIAPHAPPPGAGSGPVFPGPGALVKINPSTGVQSTLSDFNDPDQGPFGPVQGSFTSALAVESARDVFVVHSLFGEGGRGALFRVDPSTGVRTILSDFGDATKGPAAGSSALAIEDSGDFLLLSPEALIRVNRFTGRRAILSDFTDPAQGPSDLIPLHVAVEETGQILVSAFGADANVVFRVNPSSGVRTIVSDAFDPAQGPPVALISLTLDHSGNVLWAVNDDPSVIPILRTVHLFQMDPTNGVRTVVDDDIRCVSPQLGGGSITPLETGDIAMVARTFGPFPNEAPVDSVHRVNATTGTCGFVTNSPVGQRFDLAVVPTPLVNGMVSLSVIGTILEPSMDDPHAPVGVFRITATFTNETTIPVRSPFFRVAELSGGNMLVSGDQPPDLIRMGGRGARQTADVGIDGLLSPGESVTVEFGIGLQTRQPFTFFVNVFGEPDAGDVSP